MAPFPPWSNSVFAAALLLIVGGAAFTLFLGWAWVRSPYNTGVGDPVAQPVVFDHRHHASDDGIDCRYCHYTVERSKYAGVPPTSLCMNCHSQIWSDSDALAPVRHAYISGEPLVWNRVHSVPDFVFFNHAIHVQRGVGCVTCHGRVDQMGAVVKAMPLTMQWCLDCHRDPGPNLRPQEQITSMTWRAEDPRQTGERIRQELSINPPEQCSGCHR